MYTPHWLVNYFAANFLPHSLQLFFMLGFNVWFHGMHYKVSELMVHRGQGPSQVFLSLAQGTMKMLPNVAPYSVRVGHSSLSLLYFTDIYYSKYPADTLSLFLTCTSDYMLCSLSLWGQSSTNLTIPGRMNFELSLTRLCKYSHFNLLFKLTVLAHH